MAMSDADWKSTLLLNFERAAAAGIVWTVVTLLTAPNNQSVTESLKMLYMFPLGYLFGLMPIGLIAIKLGEQGIEWAKIVGGVISLLIVVGDPIVYLLSKLLPHIVPVQQFKMFNRVLVLLVSKSA